MDLSQNGYGVPKFSERVSEKYSWNLSLRNILRNIAESQISDFFTNRPETENILPKNMNSEIIQNSLNTVQVPPRFHSEKAPPTAQACSLDLFLREISRAPFRGNKWLSSLELAARRAKLIGKTHVRTPQVRRLLPKRELVRKGSEKNCEECVSSETCSTHSLEQTSSPRVSPFSILLPEDPSTSS